MIGNILFKFLWSMLIWLGSMIPHVGIWVNLFDLSCGMHCWYYVLCSFQVVYCCFITVLSIVHFFFLFQLGLFLSLMMWICVCVNTDLHPASHILLMDINELCVIPSRIWTSPSVLGIFYNANIHSLFGIIFLHFGVPLWLSFAVVCSWRSVGLV